RPAPPLDPIREKARLAGVPFNDVKAIVDAYENDHATATNLIEGLIQATREQAERERAERIRARAAAPAPVVVPAPVVAPPAIRVRRVRGGLRAIDSPKLAGMNASY